MVRQSTTVTSSLQRRILRVLQARPLPASQLLGYVDAHPSEVRRAGRLLARLGFIADSGGRLVVTEAGEAALDTHYRKLQRQACEDSLTAADREALAWMHDVNITRAARRESAVTLERAVSTESTERGERAALAESTAEQERAVRHESAVSEERAGGLERAGTSERAALTESTVHGER